MYVDAGLRGIETDRGSTPPTWSGVGFELWSLGLFWWVRGAESALRARMEAFVFWRRTRMNNHHQGGADQQDQGGASLR